LVDGISSFATAMGIEVKPSKSYMYTNIPGPPVYVTTYPQADTKYKLTTPTHTNLREIGASDYTRYLGNIQNAAGHSPLETIKMHDDSTYENIQTKIKNHTATLKRKNITAGGLLQVLKVVLHKQILYPTTFANVGEMDLNPIQSSLQSALRRKLRLPSHIHSDYIHAHEDMGGMGQDRMIDEINVQRLTLLIRSLEGTPHARQLMLGAIERLQKYARISTPPLTTFFTHTIDPPQGMWLYHLKVWMEQHNLTLDCASIKNMDCAKSTPHIMSACTRKTQSREMWRWCNIHNLTTFSDLLLSNAENRQDIWQEDTCHTRSSFLHVLAPAKSAYRTQIARLDIYQPGRWIHRADGCVGQVIRQNGRHIEVTKWTQTSRI
jgi:hypothetical protein